MSDKIRKSQKALGSYGKEMPADEVPEAGSSAILITISSLRAKVLLIKSEIIDSKMEQLATAIRGNYHRQKKETNTEILEIKGAMSKNTVKLTSLEENASTTSDTTVKMEQELGKFKRTVEQLTEKCTDVKCCSRKQNIRILNIKESTEPKD